MAPPRSPLVSLKICPIAAAAGGEAERDADAVVDGVARVDQHGVVHEAAATGDMVEDEDLAQSSADGGWADDDATDDDAVVDDRDAATRRRRAPRPGGRDAGDPPVRRRRPSTRHAPVADWRAPIVNPDADVGDARRATPAAAATAASHRPRIERAGESAGRRGLMCTAPPRAAATVTGNLVHQTQHSARIRVVPVSLGHPRRARSPRRRRQAADIVDVGGRRFRKQSGSIGERLERVRGGATAEGRRRAAPRKMGGWARLPRRRRRGLGAASRRSTPGRRIPAQHAGGAADRRPADPRDSHAPRPGLAQIRRDHDASIALPAGPSTKALPSGIEPPPPGSILVVAPSLTAARDAKRALELALERALSSPKLPYTHFVCVPLCLGDDGERLVRVVRAFHRDVLSSEYAEQCDIEPAIAHEPGHAHLTLCMLKLFSDEAGEGDWRDGRVGRRAKDWASAAAASAEPIQLEIKGLDAMNSDFSRWTLFLKVRRLVPSRERGDEPSAVCETFPPSRLSDAGLTFREWTRTSR